MAADREPTREQSPAAHDEQSSMAPFYHRAFAVLWSATVISNIGTWMQNAAAGWLMTNLDPRPFTVDRKSTRLNSSHITRSRMPSSA